MKPERASRRGVLSWRLSPADAGVSELRPRGVKERRAELASLTHRCGAFSSAVTKKLGQLGREEGHPHPPSVAFISFSDGLELPALPTEDELPRAIEAFDQARNRLHTAQLKAKALGIT